MDSNPTKREIDLINSVEESDINLEHAEEIVAAIHDLSILRAENAALKARVEELEK